MCNPFRRLRGRGRYDRTRGVVELNAPILAGAAIVTGPLDGIVTTWNKEAGVLFGYAAEEVIDHPSDTILGLSEWIDERERRLTVSGEQKRRGRRDTPPPQYQGPTSCGNPTGAAVWRASRGPRSTNGIRPTGCPGRADHSA
jgi:PAS domain-containing protein